MKSSNICNYDGFFTRKFNQQSSPSLSVPIRTVAPIGRWKKMLTRWRHFPLDMLLLFGMISLISATATTTTRFPHVIQRSSDDRDRLSSFDYSFNHKIDTNSMGTVLAQMQLSRRDNLQFVLSTIEEVCSTSKSVCRYLEDHDHMPKCRKTRKGFKQWPLSWKSWTCDNLENENINLRDAFVVRGGHQYDDDEEEDAVEGDDYDIDDDEDDEEDIDTEEEKGLEKKKQASFDHQLVSPPPEDIPHRQLRQESSSVGGSRRRRYHEIEAFNARKPPARRPSNSKKKHWSRTIASKSIGWTSQLAWNTVRQSSKVGYHLIRPKHVEEGELHGLWRIDQQVSPIGTKIRNEYEENLVASVATIEIDVRNRIVIVRNEEGEIISEEPYTFTKAKLTGVYSSEFVAACMVGRAVRLYGYRGTWQRKLADPKVLKLKGKVYHLKRNRGFTRNGEYTFGSPVGTFEARRRVRIVDEDDDTYYDDDEDDKYEDAFDDGYDVVEGEKEEENDQYQDYEEEE